jgi:hypothetical protein
MNSQIVIVHYSVLALTVFVSAYLFTAVKRNLRGIETRNLRRGESLRAQLQVLSEELETVRKEMEIRDKRSDPSVALGRTLGSGVRIQALRMIKHGEGPERIAAALSIPRTEIELLAKVHKVVAGQQPQPTS